MLLKKPEKSKKKRSFFVGGEFCISSFFWRKDEYSGNGFIFYEKVMQKNSVFKCSMCGNVVEMTHIGGGTLSCCGKPMLAMPELKRDAGEEKHAPVITTTDTGIKVHAGSIGHPMEDDHYIEWIELIADGAVCRKYLEPHEAPEAIFFVEAGVVKARAYCNKHGLWISA